MPVNIYCLYKQHKNVNENGYWLSNKKLVAKYDDKFKAYRVQKDLQMLMTDYNFFVGEDS
jgi:hypothetical protein